MCCLKVINDDERRVVAVNPPDPQGLGTPELEVWDGESTELYDASDFWLPDLDDPATLGCLLALVREAYGCEVAAIPAGRMWWWVAAFDGKRRTLEGGPSKKVALVAALEAAP